MQTVITIDSKDFSLLLDKVSEERDTYARIIAEDAANGREIRSIFIEKFACFERIHQALIDSKEID